MVIIIILQGCSLISDFGDEAVDCLASHFKPCLKTVEQGHLNEEWTTLKSEIYSSKTWEQDLKALSWLEVNRLYGEKCKNILSLIDLILTLPVSTAECERGFSWLKRTKTDWRSSLNSRSLNDLMTISMVSPSISEFDPQAAIELWANSSRRARRVTYGEGRVRKQRSSEPVCVESFEPGEVSETDSQSLSEVESRDEAVELEEMLQVVEEEEEGEEILAACAPMEPTSDEEDEYADGAFSTTAPVNTDSDIKTTAQDILNGLRHMRNFQFHYNPIDDELLEEGRI